MKTLTKTIIAIIIIFILAGFIYALLSGRAEAPQSIHAGGSTAIPANWQTFTDSQSGISLEAPNDFTVADGHGIFAGLGIFSLVIPTTTPYAHTHLLHEALVSINAPTSTCAEEVQDVFASSTEVSINGVNFTRTTTGDVGAGNIYQGVDYTAMHNGLCYRVSLFTHSTNGEGFYTDDPQQIATVDAAQATDIKNLFALFDQIASTIKFSE